MTTQISHLRPNSFRIRFAYRFLRSLKKLYKHRRPNAYSTPREIYRRYHKVKMAANASMASAVGSKRVWSRVLLWKIRNRAWKRRPAAHTHQSRRRSSVSRRIPRQFSGSGKASELRKLVPGGEAMDVCSLLGETAHYIKCLTTQVQVMRNIVDCYSS